MSLMRDILMARAILLTGAFLLVLAPGLAEAQDKDKEESVAAAQIAKVYAESAAAFDKAYKGKTLTLEGIVAMSAAKDGQKTYLMIDGYQKPGEPFVSRIRCEESSPDFQGIRVGHKVRISGTVQGHKDTLAAPELRDCKVVKVFAADYPPSMAVKEEVKKLQGKWKVVAMQANGKKLEGAEAPFTAVSFEGYNVYLHQGSQALHFGVSLDLAKDPKGIDLVSKQTLPSIYLLEGDNLQLFLPALLKSGGFRRASGFDTVKNAGILLKTERLK